MAILGNMDGFDTVTTCILCAILGISGIMSGLSGFGFSAVGAICLVFLPPALAVPLLMALSTANQLISLRKLRSDLKPLRDWWPDGPGPYLLGGLLGVPIGLEILQILPIPILMAIFGTILVCYAVYSTLKSEDLRLSISSHWLGSSIVGIVGGILGGFTAFPGAAVVVWTGLLHMPKSESRAIVQPYILCLQILALSILMVEHPDIFSPLFWRLFLITAPIVLTGTLLGVKLYRSLSDLNFRRVTFMLLGVSGAGILLKGLSALVDLSALLAAAPP